MEARARKDWRRVCAEVGSMRKEWDARNAKATEALDRHNRVKSFVEKCLTNIGNDTDYVERSGLYILYKACTPSQEHMGKRDWFDELQSLLGADEDIAHPRAEGVRRPRSVWFGWKVQT